MTRKQKRSSSPGDARLSVEAQEAVNRFEQRLQLALRWRLLSALVVSTAVAAIVATAISDSAANYTFAVLLALSFAVVAGLLRSSYHDLKKVIKKRPALERASSNGLDIVDAVVAVGFVLVVIPATEGSVGSAVLSTILLVIGLGGISMGLNTYVVVSGFAAHGRGHVRSNREHALLSVTRASSVFAILLTALSIVDAFDSTRGRTWIAVLLALLVLLLCFSWELWRRTR